MSKVGVQKHYTVYLNKTDEVIAVGAARECAAAIKVGLDSFYNICSRSRKGKLKKYTFVVEEMQ